MANQRMQAACGGAIEGRVKTGKRGSKKRAVKRAKRGKKAQNPPQWVVGQNGTEGNGEKSANRLVKANERGNGKMCQFSGAVTQ